MAKLTIRQSTPCHNLPAIKTTGLASKTQRYQSVEWSIKMDINYRREKTIRAIKLLLAIASLLPLCMVIYWFAVPSEKHTNHMLLIFLGVTVTAYTSIYVIFLRIVLPLIKHIEKEKIVCEEKLQKRIEQLRQDVSIAKASNQAKSDFLANMSHELRTPLHIIKNFAYMILKKSTILMEDLETVKDPETRRYLLETLKLDPNTWQNQVHHWALRIVENEERQLLTINDLLNLTKLEAGKTLFKFQRDDLSKALCNCVEELDSLFKKRNIQWAITPSKGNTKASIDPMHFRSVIRNLLSNALKCTPSGGKVTLSVETDIINERPSHVIKIQDSGHGIPKDELESIFEPFAQSSFNGTSSGGTGLGLAICKEVVKAHGGTIKASNHDEGGAIFTVIIPKSPPPQNNKEGESCVF